MAAILFGSISTVADTSELQREAFNQAFEAHGLGWRWDRDEYRSLLSKSGGEQRIAEYARSRAQEVDAAAVHETKSTMFQQNLATAGLTAREGVVATIKGAKAEGLRVGLVTTTSPGNVSALLGALGPELASGDFDVIVDASRVQLAKPDKAAYAFALESLHEAAADCVAVEDNPDGVRAAVAAGVVCVAFPNENTAQLDAGPAEIRVERLDLGELRQLTGSVGS